ncbi:hypothetical protein [Alkaliphilus peptidifermentans]|uniref:Uncharacterized protein n=1 Tax=Alkaliphilus peptidifermentans DSM 18978 TaxID=1120976 RepID=A0A1G5JK86_9FIRM|nr:hypothetical protein [Alkaliphilus peptidifermentans]SCY88785.1 hypothetical protein SAMN03080606_02889 [Alkaliphilus peptidifermentans DSM 18978]
MKFKGIFIIAGVLILIAALFGGKYITGVLKETSEEIEQSRNVEDILKDVYNMTGLLVGDNIIGEHLEFTEENIDNLIVELTNSNYYYKPSLIDGLNEWKEGNLHRLTALRNFTGEQLNIHKTNNSIIWENMPEWTVKLAKENGHYPEWLEEGFKFNLWEDALGKFVSMDFATEEDKIEAAKDILRGMEFESEEEWEEAFQELMNSKE